MKIVKIALTTALSFVISIILAYFTYLGYNDRVYKDQFDLQNQIGCSYTV